MKIRLSAKSLTENLTKTIANGAIQMVNLRISRKKHYWIILNHDTHYYIDTDVLSNYDIEIGGVHFDFAAVTDTGYYAYFDSTLGEGVTSLLWKEIDFVTTQHRPFYKNEYYLLTVNRVPDSFWTLSKQYDNVHIVQRKSLLAEFKKDYNRIAHPRFVPSFVGRQR